MIYHVILGLIFLVAITAVNPDLVTRGFSSLAGRPGYKTLEASATLFASLGEGEAKKENEPAHAPDPFAGIRLEAKSAYVLDMRTGKLMYEKNSLVSLPLASLAKLLTALLLEERALDSALIPLSRDAIAQDEGEGLEIGDKLKKGDLINFMLAGSSNDAAFAAGEFIGARLDGNERAGVSRFVALMNERARELGMLSSSFLNPHGLDVIINFHRISGANGSAFDVAALMDYIFRNYPCLLSATRETEIWIPSARGRIYTAPNTNESLGAIPQLIGAKTGTTKLAGANLAFIFDAGFERPVLAVLLGSTEEQRIHDAKKIVEVSFLYIQAEESEN